MAAHVLEQIEQRVGWRTPSGLWVSEERVGPEGAAAYLRTSVGNRKINQRRVVRLAAAMCAHTYFATGETVIIDRLGRLQQGHHRMHAIILSGEHVTLLIVRDVDPAARPYQDSGASWSLKDHLSARDEPNARALASVVTWHWRYEHKDLEWRQLSPSSAELLDWYDERPELKQAFRATDSVRRQVRLSQASLGGFYPVAMALSAEDAEFFYDKVGSGAELGEGHPILALRRWAELRSRRSQSREQTDAGHLAAILIKAWNYYRDGDTINNLRWRRGGASPEAFPEAH